MAPSGGSLLSRAVPKPEALPRVEFRQVAPAGPRAQPGQNEKVNESYGFNKAENWEMPDNYMKWLQPIEADLSKQVEYDMDDIDQVWLDAVNSERRKEGLDAVSYEFFEILMDRLEKEWFELSARIPKPASAIAVEDQKCAICDDGECENSNAIVFCDGCNLAVHQDCYGVPYIPEGQWLCRKCTVSPDKPVSCVLCPNEGGAFKQTTSGGWAHLLCAIWVPETGVSNTIYMEPVDGVEMVPKSRWRLICYLCKKRIGAPIQCSNRSCFTAFHVTCARDYGLHLKLRVQTADYKAFCHKHEPREMGAVEPTLLETEDEGNLSASQGGRKRKRGEEPPPPPKPQKKIRATPKSSRAYSRAFASGPPIIPFYIHTRLWEYVDRVRLRNKKAFVAMACRYWSLKREARRGAPLLKRLHLEPWTAAAINGLQSDADKAKKLKLINRLRADLENVRMLCELVKKREKEKLRRAQLLKALIDDHMFPYTTHLRDALQKIVELDKTKLFAKPVDRIAVPDYYDVVQRPMDWSTMSDKVERHEYASVEQLAEDVALVLHNAMLYNKKETPFYKAAAKLQKQVEPILAELRELDDPSSAFQNHAVELMHLLDEDCIEAFHQFTIIASPQASPAAVSPKSLRKRKASQFESPKLSQNGSPKALRTASPQRKTRARSTHPDSEEESENQHVPVDEGKQLSESEEDKKAKRDARNTARRAARARRKAEKAPSEQTSETVEDGSRHAKRREDAVSTDADEGDIPHEIVGDGSLYASDVTAYASFLSFNTGWILPEGSRRRKANDASELLLGPRNPHRISEMRNSTEVLSSSPVSSEVESVDNLELKRSRSSRRQVKSANGRKANAKAAESDEEGNTASVKPHKGANRFKELLAENAAPPELEEGSLVWAKMDPWPYWPAEIADADADVVPPNVMDQQPQDDPGARLVHFFDAHRTWAWVTPSRLALLAENDELDQLMCSKSRVPDSRKRSQIKAALATALANMEA